MHSKDLPIEDPFQDPTYWPFDFDDCPSTSGSREPVYGHHYAAEWEEFLAHEAFARAYAGQFCEPCAYFSGRG
jgi:hypothetical protein